MSDDETIEFWFNNIHYPIIVNNLKNWPKNRPEKPKDLIHVIKYSAYLALHQELDEARKVIEKYANPQTHSMDKNGEVWYGDYFDYETAREYLAKYKKENL